MDHYSTMQGRHEPTMDHNRNLVLCGRQLPVKREEKGERLGKVLRGENTIGNREMYSEILSRRMLLLPYIYWVCSLCTSSGEMFHLLPPSPPVLCVVLSVLSGEENPWNFEEKYQKDYLLQLFCSRGCCSDEGRERSPCVWVWAAIRVWGKTYDLCELHWPWEWLLLARSAGFRFFYGWSGW